MEQISQVCRLRRVWNGGNRVVLGEPFVYHRCSFHSLGFVADVLLCSRAVRVTPLASNKIMVGGLYGDEVGYTERGRRRPPKQLD